jgi:hypothetical protein
VHEGDLEVEVVLEFFNTPGTEITPGSDVVCEDFQFNGIVHSSVFLRMG